MLVQRKKHQPLRWHHRWHHRHLWYRQQPTRTTTEVIFKHQKSKKLFIVDLLLYEVTEWSTKIISVLWALPLIRVQCKISIRRDNCIHATAAMSLAVTKLWTRKLTKGKEALKKMGHSLIRSFEIHWTNRESKELALNHGEHLKKDFKPSPELRITSPHYEPSMSTYTDSPVISGSYTPPNPYGSTVKVFGRVIEKWGCEE